MTSESDQREDYPLQQRHLLVADDCPTNLKLIRHILERAGAHVSTSSNGRELCDMLVASISGGQSIELVLTDLQMPDMDGLRAVRELRKQGVTTPVIAVTARDSFASVDRCINQGFNDFVIKPIDPDVLLAVVLAHLPPAQPDEAA